MALKKKRTQVPTFFGSLEVQSVSRECRPQNTTDHTLVPN